MQESALIFLTAFTVGFSGAMMPGPMLTMVINHSIRTRLKGGLLVVVGHAILEASLVLALIFGLHQWLKLPTVNGIIGLAGGAVLLYLGFLMVRDARQGKVTLDTTVENTGEKYSGPGPVSGGILTSISNPYWSLWWATVGAGYLVLARKQGFPGISAFFTGHILADFTWYALISIAVAKGFQLLSQKVYLGLIQVCGIFLLGLGCYFLYSGWNFLA